MSLAAIGDYSGSDSDSDKSNNEEGQAQTSSSESEREEEEVESREQKGRNYLEVGEEDKDSSGEDSDEAGPSHGGKAKRQRLPSARLVLSMAAPRAGTGIFHTAYDEEAAEAKAVLERHVGVTQEMELNRKNRLKGICYNWRDGKGCRKGSRCPFSHVLAGGVRANQAMAEQNRQAIVQRETLGEAPSTLCAAKPNASAERSELVQDITAGHRGRYTMRKERHSREMKPPPGEKPMGGGGWRRKIRAGVTDSLIPPKKAQIHFARIARATYAKDDRDHLDDQ